MASLPNVLPLFRPPTQKVFREAVAQCIRDIRKKHGLTNGELAEYLGCHSDTIRNAVAEENDLSAVTLARMAYCFGEDAIGPYRALYLPGAVEHETTATRLQRIIRELEAIGREQAE